MTVVMHHVGGAEFGDAVATGAIYNPATGVETGRVAFATTDEVNHAITVAVAARVRGTVS